jgi:hypothetical protein
MIFGLNKNTIQYNTIDQTTPGQLRMTLLMSFRTSQTERRLFGKIQSLTFIATSYIFRKCLPSEVTVDNVSN